MTDTEYGRMAHKYDRKIREFYSKQQQGGYDMNIFARVNTLRIVINESDKYDISIEQGTKARDAVEALFRSAELLKLSPGVDKMLVEFRTSVLIDGTCKSQTCKQIKQGEGLSVRLALDTIPRLNGQKWEARHTLYATETDDTETKRQYLGPAQFLADNQDLTADILKSLVVPSTPVSILSTDVFSTMASDIQRSIPSAEEAKRTAEQLINKTSAQVSELGEKAKLHATTASQQIKLPTMSEQDRKKVEQSVKEMRDLSQQVVAEMQSKSKQTAEDLQSKGKQTFEDLQSKSKQTLDKLSETSEPIRQSVNDFTKKLPTFEELKKGAAVPSLDELLKSSKSTAEKSFSNMYDSARLMANKQQGGGRDTISNVTLSKNTLKRLDMDNSSELVQYTNKQSWNNLTKQNTNTNSVDWWKLH